MGGIATIAGKYFEIFAQSAALLTSCLAYQTTLDAKYAALEDNYYHRSIAVFRPGLQKPTSVDNEATVYAALLLCSTSMNRGVPWTVHRDGIASILDHNNLYNFPNGRIKDYTAFMGILDLPIYALGRKTEARNIWYNHCRFQTGRDVLTGNPCSLIDLLSAIHQPDNVAALFTRSSHEGTTTEKRIWQCISYAATIVAMRIHQPVELDGTQARCLIKLLYDLDEALGDPSPHDKPALLFPLVIAGSEPHYLTGSDRDFILAGISKLADGSLDSSHYFNGAARIMHQLWSDRRGTSLEQIALALDLEQGLF